MKIVFVSNYFNHHQEPFCEEMYRMLGENFAFISTSVMREERRALGYSQDASPSYVLHSYIDEQSRSNALSLINDADVVIAGSAPNDLFCDRIREGKLLFRYSERPFKKEPSFLRRLYHWINFRKMNLYKKNVYMLCAGAYAAKDFESLGMYKNRMFKWGYFPKLKQHNVNELLQNKKRSSVLWCGRFLDWKHPDDAIRAAGILKDEGYDFDLNLIGTGKTQAELIELVRELGVSDRVHFLGSMAPDQVRLHMETAGIYLLTSDRNEGWGAVLNEAMNSCCAIVASDAVGSVSYLMKNGENGTVYSSGNVEALAKGIKEFLDYPEKQEIVGSRAYETVASEWNAKIAAERFVRFAECALAGEKLTDLFVSGPCSFAKISI